MGGGRGSWVVTGRSKGSSVLKRYEQIALFSVSYWSCEPRTSSLCPNSECPKVKDDYF